MDTIERLNQNLKTGNFTQEDIKYLLNIQGRDQEILFNFANEKKQRVFGDSVLLRGVIEISNICRNTCKYCGMSAENKSLNRYFINDLKTLISTADYWIRQGIRVFHISSGETALDPNILNSFIQYLYKKECEIILVLGAVDSEVLKSYRMSGAKYYISKFETSNHLLYSQINNKSGSLENKLKFIKKLETIGYRVGTGNIVGLPGQNDDILVNDLMQMKSIAPKLASTSVFIPNEESQYKNEKKGSIQKTLNYISILRLIMEDKVYIPTNSSLGKEGKIKALQAGANMISINITPPQYLYDYVIYSKTTRQEANMEYIREMIRGLNCNLKYKIEG